MPEEDEARPLTYVGPAEDGSVEVKRSGGGLRSTLSSRRERREAKRQQAREKKSARRS